VVVHQCGEERPPIWLHAPDSACSTHASATMNRRNFLQGALSALAAVPAVSYFDMGASWKKHDNGLWTGPSTGWECRELLYPDQQIILSPDDFGSFLKSHYNDQRVNSVVWKGRWVFSDP